MLDNLKQLASDTVDKMGYYTVNINLGQERVPYVVYATSDYHAARLVRNETGYLASQHDVEGPYSRF